MKNQDIDALVSTRVADLIGYIDANVVPLMIRRMLAGISSDASPGRKPPPPRVDHAPPWPSPPRAASSPEGRGPIGRGLSNHVILSALASAPPEGLHGRDLNRRMVAAGLTIDTAEVWKTRLRHRGVLDHDTSTGLWSLSRSVREAYPDLSRIVPPEPRPRPRTERPPGGQAGSIVMLLLASRDGAVPSHEVHEAVTSAGYSFSTARHAINELRIARLITNHDGGWREATDRPTDA